MQIEHLVCLCAIRISQMGIININSLSKMEQTIGQIIDI